MELSHFQTKLLRRNLNYFLHSLEENSITLETEDPANIEKCVVNITDFFRKQSFRLDIFSNIFLIEYGVSLVDKKILYSGCYLNGFDKLNTSEFEIVHKKCLKFLSDKASFLDYPKSNPRLSWKGKKLFNNNNVPNITYVFPNNVLIEEEKLEKFYNNFVIDDQFNYMFLPTSIEFEYGIPIIVTMEAYEDGKFYEFDWNTKTLKSIRSPEMSVHTFKEQHIHKYENMIVPDYIDFVDIVSDPHGNEISVNFFIRDLEKIRSILLDTF